MGKETRQGRAGPGRGNARYGKGWRCEGCREKAREETSKGSARETVEN